MSNQLMMVILHLISLVRNHR